MLCFIFCRAGCIEHSEDAPVTKPLAAAFTSFEAALSICQGGGCDKPGLYLATPLILFMDARDLLASHRGHLSHCDWGLVGRCWGVCFSLTPPAAAAGAKNSPDPPFLFFGCTLTMCDYVIGLRCSGVAAATVAVAAATVAATVAVVVFTT